MADRDAKAKLLIYRTMYRLNLCFTHIVEQCRALRDSGVLTRKEAHLYESSAKELQAEINEDAAIALCSIEGHDTARFGKVRHDWEKSLRDPDDVFLLAEERLQEIARKGGKVPASARRIMPPPTRDKRKKAAKAPPSRKQRKAV